MPVVSVLMPVFNGEKYLAEAIDSILSQTFADFELLIVDDGSQDGSADIIRAYEKRDERIRFFQLDRNTGIGAAKNHAIRTATGDFVTSMDCDDVSLPERLQKQVDFMMKHLEIGVLGTCGHVVDEDLIPLFDYTVPQYHAHIALNIPMGYCVLGATAMIRSELLELIDGYNTSRARGSDIELNSRLIRRTRFANLPKKLYLYRRHEGQRLSAPEAKRDWNKLLRRIFTDLWGEAPPESLDRLARVRSRDKFWLGGTPTGSARLRATYRLDDCCQLVRA